NVLAIVFLIMIIRKVFTMLKDKKKKQEPNTWRN
ncbi:preprotein translocase subunit Tim44, partial [Pseudomonas sp. MPR-R5A]